MVFNYEQTLRWSEPVRKAALRRLYALDAATNLMDLRSPPSNRLEKLHGDLAGQIQHPHQRPMADLFCVAGRWRVGTLKLLTIIEQKIL